MTTDTLTLEASPRSVTGKKVRFMRRTGVTPLHLYGKGAASLNLQADSAVLQRLVIRAGRNIPVSVSVEGTRDTHFAFIREVQRNPLTEAIVHVDFYQVSMAEVMRAQVPVYLVGEPPAVRMLNGVLNQALNSIEVECLPLDVPQNIEVDVSELADFEQAIYVSGINLGVSVTIITDPGELIARVNPPRVAVEEEVLPVSAAGAGAEEGTPEQPAPEGSSSEEN